MISWKEFNRVKKIDGVESQKICTVNSAKNHGMSPQVRYILSQINWKWTIQQKFKVLKKLLKSKKVRVEISKRMWILSHIRYCLWQRKWKWTLKQKWNVFTNWKLSMREKVKVQNLKRELNFFLIKILSIAEKVKMKMSKRNWTSWEIRNCLWRGKTSGLFSL